VLKPTYYKKLVSDPDAPNMLDTRGRTVTQHEQGHGEIAKNEWNKIIKVINLFEGTYCNNNCAVLAHNIVVHRHAYASNMHVIAQVDYDLDAYDEGRLSIYRGKLQIQKNQAESKAKKAQAELTETINDYVKKKCNKIHK
jgi:predicted secreted Zn-dependent protease